MFSLFLQPPKASFPIGFRLTEESKRVLKLTYTHTSRHTSNSTTYNATLLPSVNTLIVRGLFCGAKYTHHTFTPIIKHLVTATANKHPGKKSVTDNMRKSHWHQAVHIT